MPLTPQLRADRVGSLLPKGKRVAPGRVSTKTPKLEATDDPRRRVEEASRFAPLEQLAPSPQCGFASSIEGNPLTLGDQKAKLARVVEVAGAMRGGR